MDNREETGRAVRLSGSALKRKTHTTTPILPVRGEPSAAQSTLGIRKIGFINKLSLIAREANGLCKVSRLCLEIGTKRSNIDRDDSPLLAHLLARC